MFLIDHKADVVIEIPESDSDDEYEYIEETIDKEEDASSSDS